MSLILVVDDNEAVREGVAAAIRKMGHHVEVAASGSAGLQLAKAKRFDFVITDLKMDQLDGVAVLREMAALDPDVPVMIMTGFGTVEAAVEAMKHGAFDFITKPFSPDVVRLKTERALELVASRRERQRLVAHNDYLKAAVRVPTGLVGESAGMQAVQAAIAKVAPTDATVFIHGESGTGKEMVAQAIHDQSQRSGGPFIRVNCGALTESLLESELFGHERGAFTGAVKQKLGRFELANNGTIFLDEIAEVSPAMQVKLLRVLQERTLDRVGGEKPVAVNVRVLSATNKDLAREVAEGRFRQDLFFRLHVVTVALPPLRDRGADIGLLARHFVGALAPKINPKVSGIASATIERLARHAWPGNVRELANIIEQALVFAEGDTILPEALPMALGSDGTGASVMIASETKALPEVLEDLERQLILRAYEKAGKVKTDTAKALGIKTSALYYKLEKYGIE